MDEILNKLIELAKDYGKLEVERDKYKDQSNTFYKLWNELKEKKEPEADGEV